MTSKAKKQPSRNSVKKKAPEPVTETVIEGEAVVMPDEPAPDQPRKDTSFNAVSYTHLTLPTNSRV